MERLEKSPRNQAIYEQYKIDRKLKIKELKAKGEFPRVLTAYDLSRIEAARQRRYEERLLNYPLSEA